MEGYSLKKPLKMEQIIQKNVGSENLLYNPATKSVHVINKTSSLIWELCDGEHDVDMIEKELKKRFDVKNETNVKNDIHSTLSELKRLGLIEFGL